MVREKLLAKGIEILSESDINGKTIDEKKLIDQHYYAIASKATILPAEEIPVPDDKFEEAFGEKWSEVLKEGRAANAMQACKKFGCNAEELDAACKKRALSGQTRAEAAPPTHVPAGFEGGTNIFINPLTPIDLRDRLVPRMYDLRAGGRINGAIRIAEECRVVPNPLQYYRHT